MGLLLPGYNHRIDEYGGTIDNLWCVVQRVVSIPGYVHAVGKDCGVALRISLEELRAKAGLHHESF